MAEPRKKKKKRKTGRPLEDVPLEKLVQNVRRNLDEKIRLSFSGGKDQKSQQH